MPESYSFFKTEVKQYFKNNVPTNKRILDVGPGIGTYSDLIREFGYKMDCIEIYEQYTTQFNLKDKYDNVIIGNIVDFDYSDYDYIIFGDVLEHITETNSKKLISDIVSKGKDCLVAIPYLMEQGEYHGNIYEAHLQPDLTPDVMNERFPELEVLYSNSYYGYFVNRKISNKEGNAYVLYSDENYFEVVKACAKSIREFSSLPIYVYMLNSDLKVDIDNVTTIKWDCNIDDGDDNLYHKENQNSNYYINRSNKRIYSLLIQRPLIVKHCLENFAKTIAYIDSDSVATPYIDNIFNFYDSKLIYPYFVEGIYDFLIINGRGNADSMDDLSGTLEHPACEVLNVNQYVRRNYRQTGYFVAGENTIDFLDEWYWMCTNPKILKNFDYYAPYHEETIMNVLRWKHNIHDGLPYLYVNGTSETVDKVYRDIKFNNRKNYISSWFKIPKDDETLLFFHGEKRPEVMEEMTNKIKHYHSTDRVKVLFLAPHLSTGGMPSFLLKRIEELSKYPELIDMYVVEFSNHSDHYVVQKNRIKELIPPSRFWTLDKNKLEVINIIKNNKIDVIHLDEMLESFDAYNKVSTELMNQLYDNNRTWKVVETCHNVSFNPYVSKKFHPEAYAFCTPYHKEKTFTTMPSYSEVLEFPIDNHITSEEDKLNARTQLGIDLNKKHIINVGLWTQGKNQKEGIELARLLEKTNPELQFHFIGNQAPNFQEYWEPIMKDIPSNVIVWGERSDVDLFMKSADVLMFNSTWECNPLVLREAASYGLKILSRNLPQYLDMFTQYITPIDGDLTSTKNKLLQLLDSKVSYTLPQNQSEDFAKNHIKLYNKVKNMDITKQEKILSDIEVTQYFVEKPFLEIKGTDDGIYNIKFRDEEGVVHYENNLPLNRWVKLNRQYYTKWNTQITKDGNVVYDNTLDYTGKRVYIAFDSKSLGDSIAWIPYALEFKKKHNCTVIVSTFWNKLFKKTYPELEFVEPGVTVHNLYGMYKFGWFYDTDKEPELPNTIPLQKTATNILGLEFTEIKPEVNFVPKGNPYNTKYVTIANESTSGLKYWNNPTGWQELVDYLVSKGYKVINVSKKGDYLKNVTKLKDTSIENTMNVIHHSEFFVGLSSGLSWLSWGIGKHVVMISNFTEPDHEFTTNCTRITNPSVCNGCWNNPKFKFDKGDWYWCPEHKGTPRHFECHKSITSEMVINQIQHLIK
jgi:autotransporter strand-loop-strand O-heptosyltransferase